MRERAPTLILALALGVAIAAAVRIQVAARAAEPDAHDADITTRVADLRVENDARGQALLVATAPRAPCPGAAPQAELAHKREGDIEVPPSNAVVADVDVASLGPLAMLPMSVATARRARLTVDQAVELDGILQDREERRRELFGDFMSGDVSPQRMDQAERALDLQIAAAVKSALGGKAAAALMELRAREEAWMDRVNED